jgi:LPS O-antigen subunit length determinant protein (WzzB/FepE family)
LLILLSSSNIASLKNENSSGDWRMVLEQTIDLRPYLKSLLSRWYLILGIMVASTLVFFGVSYLLPQTYKATALVTITNLDQFTLSSLTIQNLDPSLNETSESDPLIRAYTDLQQVMNCLSKFWLK